MAPGYDVDRVRARIPALSSGLAFFDGPGGTQTPDVVADAVRAALAGPLSNRGDLTVAQENAERAVVGARAALADLLDADPAGIVFGRSFTQVTFDLARAMAKRWRPGDEVVVTRLDHDGNVRPWVIAAESVGAIVRWVDFDPDSGELATEAVAAAVGPRTRLVAVTGASNLIGTRPDVEGIAAAAHDVGAWLHVDAVHLVPHEAVSLRSSGADLIGCSTYKLLGPHAGVVAGRLEVLEQLHPDKLLPSTDEVPERFELGTLPYELMAGAAAAIDLVADLAPPPAPDATRRQRIERSMAALAGHEDRLRQRVEEGMAGLPGVTLRSRAARRTPTILATFADRDAGAVSRQLAAHGINAPAGTFYAHEAARHMRLGPDGGLRVGLAPYTDDDDVDRLLDGLGQLLWGGGGTNG